MKGLKKLAVLCAGCLAFAGIAPVFPAETAVYAAETEAPISGTCGKNLTWSFDEATGTLTIEGSGEMEDYDFDTFQRPNASRAPWCNLKINYIVLPEGITSIGKGAFDTCSRLRHVVIPNSVTSIGAGAFWFCYLLKSVIIPESVVSIGNMAFKMDQPDINDRPVTVTLPDLTITAIPGSYAANYAIINDIPFNYPDEYADARTDLLIVDNVVYNGKNCSGEVVIPEGVTAVAYEAFANNDKLTGITFPSTCQTLGGKALYHCTNLEKVTFLNPETEIVCANIAPDYWVWEATDFQSPDPNKWTITSNQAEYGEEQDPKSTDTYWIEQGYETIPDYPVRYLVYVVKDAVFSGTIYGKPGSTAEAFAKDYCDFVALDDETCWGDVNCDNSVDVADAVLICRFAVADAEAPITDQGKKQADVNHDGTVDAKDSEKLVQYIAKKLIADDLKA